MKSSNNLISLEFGLAIGLLDIEYDQSQDTLIDAKILSLRAQGLSYKTIVAQLESSKTYAEGCFATVQSILSSFTGINKLLHLIFLLNMGTSRIWDKINELIIKNQYALALETLGKIIRSEQNLILHLATKPNNHQILSYLIKQVAEFCEREDIYSLIKHCIYEASVNKCLSNFLKLYFEWGNRMPQHPKPVSFLEPLPYMKTLKEADFSCLIFEDKFCVNSPLVEINRLYDTLGDERKMKLNQTGVDPRELETKQEAFVELLYQNHRRYIVKSKDRVKQQRYYHEVIAALNQSNFSLQLVNYIYETHPELFEIADLDKISNMPYIPELVLNRGSRIFAILYRFLKRLDASDSLSFNHFPIETLQKLNQLIMAFEFNPKKFSNNFRQTLKDFLLPCLLLPPDLVAIIIEYLSDSYTIPVLSLESMRSNFFQPQNKECTMGIRIPLSQSHASSGYLALFKAFTFLDKELSSESLLSVGNEEFKQFQIEMGENMGMGPLKEYPELKASNLDAILTQLLSKQIHFSNFKTVSSALLKLQEQSEITPFTVFDVSFDEEQKLGPYYINREMPAHLKLKMAGMLYKLRSFYRLRKELQFHLFFICIRNYWYPQLISFSRGTACFSLPGLCNILDEVEDKKLTRDQKKIENQLTQLMTNRYDLEDFTAKIAKNTFPDILKELQEIVRQLQQNRLLDEVTTEKIYQYYELLHQFFTDLIKSEQIRPYWNTVIQMQKIAVQLRDINPEKFAKLYQQISELCKKKPTLSLVEIKDQRLLTPAPSSTNVAPSKCLIC